MKMNPPRPPRMSSSPTSVRDRSSDVHGSVAGSGTKPSGDKHRKVGGRRNKGGMATKRSVAKKPLGKKITHVRGQAGYHNR